MEMKYLILYYPGVDGPDGREPGREEQATIECEDDEDAKQKASHYRHARLFKEIPLR
jgi:hypothetical protein